MSNEYVAVNIVRSGVGELTQNDVELAQSLDACVMVFNLPRNRKMVRTLASRRAAAAFDDTPAPSKQARRVAYGGLLRRCWRCPKGGLPCSHLRVLTRAGWCPNCARRTLSATSRMSTSSTTRSFMR